MWGRDEAGLVVRRVVSGGYGNLVHSELSVFSDGRVILGGESVSDAESMLEQSEVDELVDSIVGIGLVGPMAGDPPVTTDVRTTTIAVSPHPHWRIEVSASGLDRHPEAFPVALSAVDAMLEGLIDRIVDQGNSEW